ncbi:MAG: hypothetical protein O8C61_05565 [Candidatus Methanoperedens sp.]|nr:hypothetical protein [Candidatus Methanoperedens sp.]
MVQVDCSLKEYGGRARLIKGDQKRLDELCENFNNVNLKRDGFLKQGVNRCNYSHAIHVALDCLSEKLKLQSTVPSQVPLSEFLKNGSESDPRIEA